jgi:hypothetical protein
MAKKSLTGAESGAKAGTWVAIQTGAGFRVYSPANPSAVFEVGGTRTAPTCTCPQFKGAIVPGFRCEHIRAVEKPVPADTPHPEEDSYEDEERRAIRDEGRAGNGAGHPGSTVELPTAQMRIKRSVSPDGRINSLSVEFSRLLDGDGDEEIAGDAERMMLLQEQIIGQFLDGHSGNGNGSGHDDDDAADAVAAKLINVAGMRTRMGWSLFLNVQVNGDTVKMFGKADALADAIRSAGYPDVAKKRIAQGMKLNLPCRVITSQSDDGKYTRIERVLPAEGSAR